MKVFEILLLLPCFISALRIKTRVKAFEAAQKWEAPRSPIDLPCELSQSIDSDSHLSRFVFHFTEDSDMYLQGDAPRHPIVIGKTRALGPKYSKNASNPISLSFSSNGQLSVVDSNGEMLRNFINPSSQDLGEENGPFVATVDFDRKFRVRNAYDAILFEFPADTSRPINTLDSQALNFLTGNQKLASKNGQWFIAIAKNGQIRTNTGFNFNNAASSRDNDPRILFLNPLGGLSFYDAYAGPIQIDRFPSDIEGLPPNSHFTAEVTNDGIFQILDQSYRATWSFDIKSTLPPPTTTSSSTQPSSSPTPSVSWLPDGEFVVADGGYDFYGIGDIYDRMGSFQDCKSFCLQDNDCTHFTWLPKNGICYLKKLSFDDLPTLTGNGQSAKRVSPLNPNPAQPRWSMNGNTIIGNHCDFPGNDISFPQASLESCKRLCDERDECSHYSWQTPHFCNLKKVFGGVSTAFAVYHPTPGWISGLSSTHFVWAFSRGMKWSYHCDILNGVGDYADLRTDPENCLAACSQDSKCTHIQWWEGTCYKKSFHAGGLEGARRSLSPATVCGMAIR